MVPMQRMAMKNTMKGMSLKVYVISTLNTKLVTTNVMSVNTPAVANESKEICANFICLVNIQTKPGTTSKIINMRIKVFTFSNVVQLLKRFIIISIVIFSLLY